MHRLLRLKVLWSVILVVLSTSVHAQVPTDTIPTGINPELANIFEQKFPRQYTIRGITVTGTRSFDHNLIISISGIAIGDRVQIPGTDVFSKAINKLWKQNLVSDVKINFTKLVDEDLYIEIEVVERPRLMQLDITGVKKSEKDELVTKLGLNKDRVVTEEMKNSAIEVIQKFYFDKGYRNVQIDVIEQPYQEGTNSVALTYHIQKGDKINVNAINFAGNLTQ